MIADTRTALVGHVLLQLQDTNKGVFDEALIYHVGISESDKNLLSEIMPCRFFAYAPPLPQSLFVKSRFKRFSKIMFARYEMFNYLDEYDSITWIDTDVLIQGSITGLIEEGMKTGFAILSEDPINKSSSNPDKVGTCFTIPQNGYDMNAWLYCTGTIVVSQKLNQKANYTDWCYKKTIEWADILDLPDQGVINALVQEFDIPVTPLNGSLYAKFPLYGEDCAKAAYLHAWGDNKFWSDWYLYEKYPQWKKTYAEWLKMGGSSFIDENITPVISVLMPIYKPDLGWLKQSLDSLVYQKHQHWQRFSNFEVLMIAEPYMQDEIKKFVDSYNDPRLQLYFNEQRLGISASLNKGMRLAKGKYIARLDDDDIANEYRLIRQRNYLDAHNDVTMCVTNYHYFGDMNEGRVIFEGEMSRAWSVFTCPFDHPTIMFRKAFFVDNELFYDEHRSHVEDWELWLRAFDKGMKVGCIQEELTYHRWHTGQAGQSNKTGEMMQELVRLNFQRLGVNVQTTILSALSPWQGKVSDEQYIQIEKIYKEALDNNTKLKLYDHECLYNAFQLRLTEAKTGTIPGIATQLNKNTSNFEWTDKPVKQSLARRILKKILMPLYAPFRNRYEYRIMNIERSVYDIQNTIGTLDDSLKINIDSANAIQAKVEYLGQLVSLNESLNSLVNAVVKNMSDTINETFPDSIRSVKDDFNTVMKTMFEHVSESNHTNAQYIIDSTTGALRPEIETLQSKITPMAQYFEANSPIYDAMMDVWVSDNVVMKKIFLVGTPEHHNIGDAAIAIGEYEFIKKYFSDHRVIEISTYDFDRKYNFMRSIITKDDLIFLQGGGNLGNKFLNEEVVRRRVISDYPNNKTVILPQTIWFTKDEDGERELNITTDIYNKHKDLLLLMRGQQSLAKAKEYFPGIRSEDALDMALMIKCDYSYDRSGILLCIRDLNDESGLNKQLYDDVFEIIKNIDPSYEKTNNLYEHNDIPVIARGMVVVDELKKFSMKKVIVTDRLHGLIFAVITKTPCVLISAFNQKIEDFVVNFNDSNAVFYIDKNITELEHAIKKAVEITEPCYPVLNNKPFDSIANAIFNMESKNG